MNVKQLNVQAILLYLETRPSWLRYLFAVLAVALAALMTIYVPVFGAHAALLLFFFAITQATYWLGLYPGLLTLGLSLIAINGLILLPAWISEPYNTLILNIGLCLLSAIIIATISRNRQLTAMLWESQQDMNLAQSVGQIGSWRLNMLRNELSWSAENHRLFNIPKNTKLTYEAFLASIHPEDRDYVDQMWQAALLGKPYDIEHRIIIGDEVKWVHEKALLEFDKRGKLLGGFGITQDITERKYSEAMLLESKQRYAGIIESAMDAIITIDINQCILLFNAAAEKMFGCTEAEAIGTSIERFIPKRFRHEHGNFIRSLAQIGHSNRKMGELGVVSGLRASGEEFPIEASISQCEIKGEKSFTAILRDATHSVRINNLMQERFKLQDQLVKVAESVPGVICSFRLRQDGSSHMPYASPIFEAVTGLSRNLVAEDFSPFFACIHPDDLIQVQETIAESAHRLQPWHNTFRYNHPSKGKLWIEGHSMPQREMDGSTLWHGYIHDVTERKLAETALSDRESQLRLIMDATPALISYLDTNFRYQLINATYQNWFCIDQQQILGHEARHIIGEKAWTIVQPYLELARSGERVSFDQTIPYGNGKPRWVHATYIPHRDSIGTVKGIVVHIVDIEERMLAEQALRKSEFEFRSVFESAGVGNAEIEIATGRYTRVNQHYCDLVGYTAEELLGGMTYLDITHPEDQLWNQTEIAPHMKQKHATFEIEKRYIHKDGVIVWVHLTGTLLQDSNGHWSRLFGSAYDISDRKRTEAALLDSQKENEFFANIIRTSSQPVGIGYPNGKLELVNTAFEELTGYSAEELQSINWVTTLTPPEWLESEQGQLAKLNRSGHPVRYEKEYLRKNGTRVPIELLVHCVTDEQNNPQYYYAFVTDISDRKQAEINLRESEERIRLATETTGVGIWEWNILTEQIHWDEQMFRTYGVTPTPNGLVHFSTWQEIVLPEDLHLQEELLQETVRQRGHNSREFRIQRPNDNALRHIQGVETVRTNARGEVEWVVGTNLDITERKQAEEKLHASEARLQLGMQVAGLALAEVDYRGDLIHLSAEAAKLFGLGEEAMTLPRATVHATFHPDDRAELLRRITQSLDPAGLGWFAMEHRVVRPDGRESWLRVHKQVFFEGEAAERQPAHAILAVLDITVEKTAAEALRLREEFIRGVLNSLPEHVVVLDEQGEVTAVNEPWERFANENGGSPCYVSEGVNYLEVCRRSSAAGDQYATIAITGLEAILTGQQQEFVMEYPCPTPRQNLWFMMHAKRVFQGSKGIILSHVDITELKTAEQALQNAQARLALIFEEVNIGYWDWDLMTRTIYLSPEWKKQLGIEGNNLLYHWDEWENRLHPDDKERVLTTIDNYINDHLPDFEIEFRLRHQDGSYRRIHSRGSLLRDEANHPYRMLGINLDITDYMLTKELNQRRDKMEQAFRLYIASQTAAAIAHELNQPLTAISSYADVALDMLNSGNYNPHKLTHVMEKCSAQAQRAGEVIRQLLTVLQKGDIIIEPIAINHSVQEAVDIVRASGDLDDFELELKLATDLLPVAANDLQIQKILINLIHNGLESMQNRGIKTGTISVTTSNSEKYPAMAEVTVSDCGTGVQDSTALKTIFQPFYTTKPSGLGMGLAISRALIEAHDGKMWAEQNIDAGISIHFTLPYLL